MTSSTDTDEHPDVAEISALTEGLLSPSRTVDVRTHLAGCVLCADVRSSLDEIRSLLGTLPGPVQMPADVAGRIDAALAAEALLDATAPETSESRTAVSRETPELSPSPDRVSRETAHDTDRTPGASKPSVTTDRPAGRPRGATGPGRGSTRPGTRSSRARHWPRILLGSACAVAVIGLGTFFVQEATSGDDTGAGPSASRNSTEHQDTLSAGTLKDRVHEMLTDRKATASPGATSKGIPDVPLRAEDPKVPSCVQKGIGRTEPALAAQQDTYDGKAAYVVVLPHPSDSSRVDAFVIDASCVSSSPSSTGKLLETRTYPRG
ncbi:hypothetical protein HUT19_20215 [Streptomyces sp. NA02950]|uniref:hypothetical protein n=1 Tax=Streptomyces sp. NA02950 TaxID=2742137 RepID=UPI001591AD9C|nr:hypothetical protein [Streptomyces sp. NA02950]QKV93795.1 hypothetical protein HUT19_20215 [Streptomyces sp. NA02950]